MNDDTTRPGSNERRNRNGPDDNQEQDLKATTDSIRADLRRLTSIEDKKHAMDPRDARLDRLSAEAVTLADRVSRQTRAELQLSEEIG